MATLSPPVQIQTPTRGNAEDLEYLRLLGRINARYLTVTKNGSEPLFSTRTPEVWRVYLDSFPIWRRQYYDCRACEGFRQRRHERRPLLLRSHPRHADDGDRAA